MPLWITENDVDRLLSVEACMGALEAAFRHWGAGRADNRPRVRAAVPGSMLHVLAAASTPHGRMAAKVYSTTRGGARFVVLLFDGATSELLAVIEADRLGQIRTGAASGLATRLLARQGARVLGIIGTGWQARSQVQAIARVRRLEEIRAFGRDRGRLIDFCADVAKATGLAVRSAATAEAAVRGADIVVTATSSATPVLSGAWLAPGAHVNAVGSNRADRRELDDEAVGRADLIVCDSTEQAQHEAGDLLMAATGTGTYGPLDRAVDLAAIVAGSHPGRADDRAITLFKSLGLGLEDLAAASLVYDRALEARAGVPIPPGAVPAR